MIEIIYYKNNFKILEIDTVTTIDIKIAILVLILYIIYFK